MKTISIIYGETYQIKEEARKKAKNILKDHYENNVAIYDLEESTMDDVLEDAATIAFLNDKKVLLINNAYFLSTTSSLTKEEQDHFFQYLKHPNPDSYLIFTLDKKLDVRKKLVKKLKEEAFLLECKTVDEKNGKERIAQRLKEEGFMIETKALNYLTDILLPNITSIEKELEKLITYKGENKQITNADITACITKPPKDIFTLVDLIIQKDAGRAIEIYEKDFKNEEEPIKLIVMLGNQFRLMYQVKCLKQEGFQESRIATMLQIHPYRVKLALEKGANYREKDLLKNIYKLAQLDEQIKTGAMNKDIALDLFFLNVI